MVLEKPGFCGWSIEYSRTLLMKNPETGFLWVEYRIFSYFVDEKPGFLCTGYGNIRLFKPRNPVSPYTYKTYM